MGQAARASQRQPRGAGSFLCHLDLHLGGPAHGGAALRELLLLPPPPQDEVEGIEHLSVAGRAAKGPRESTRGFFFLRLESFKSTDIRQLSEEPNPRTTRRLKHRDWLTLDGAAGVWGESTFFGASLRRGTTTHLARGNPTSSSSITG